MVGDANRSDPGARRLVRERLHLGAEQHGIGGRADRLGDALGRRHRLPRARVRLALAMLEDRPHSAHHSTLASARSSSTSCDAVVATSPSRILAPVPARGKSTARISTREPGGAGLPFGQAELGARQARDLLALRLHDALERRVARMVDAGLHLEHRRQPQAEDLVLARFHLAHDARRPAAVLDLDAHHQPGVRQSESSGHQGRGDAPAQVVRLRAGEDQVERLASDRRGESARGRHRVAQRERRIVQVGGAIGAQGERLAQRLAHALGAEAEHHHLAAALLADLERLLERALVALVDDEREVLFLDPGPLLVEAQASLGVGHLLDADRDLHCVDRDTPHGRRERITSKQPVLVPARPSCYLLRRNDACRYTYLSSVCSRRHKAPKVSVSGSSSSTRGRSTSSSSRCWSSSRWCRGASS